jgi:hypothetical protein
MTFNAAAAAAAADDDDDDDDVSQLFPTLVVAANVPLQPAAVMLLLQLNLLHLPGVCLLKQMPKIYLFKQICFL